MDKLKKYRKVLQNIVLTHASYKPINEGIEPLPICDSLRDEYLLMDVGWEKGERRSHEIVFHFRIHNEKIYIEADNTDAQIIREITNAGVPKDDIVLAYYPMTKRKTLDFAVV
jgi:hypothetical protein